MLMKVLARRRARCGTVVLSARDGKARRRRRENGESAHCVAGRDAVDGVDAKKTRDVSQRLIDQRKKSRKLEATGSFLAIYCSTVIFAFGGRIEKIVGLFFTGPLIVVLARLLASFLVPASLLPCFSVQPFLVRFQCGRTANPDSYVLMPGLIGRRDYRAAIRGTANVS
jgi:hypothetical protein